MGGERGERPRENFLLGEKVEPSDVIMGDQGNLLPQTRKILNFRKKNGNFLLSPVVFQDLVLGEGT